MEQRREAKSSLPLPATAPELGRAGCRGARSSSSVETGARSGGHKPLLIYFSPKAVDVAIVQRRGTFWSYSDIIFALW